MSVDQLSYVGINLPGKHGAADKIIVDTAIEQGYDLVTAKITTRSFKHKILNLFTPNLDDQRSSSTGASAKLSAPINGSAAESVVVPPLEAEDILFFPGPHVSNTIALAAPWAELDARHDVLSQVSYQVLRRELQYAQFCGLPYVVIPGPKRRTNLSRYAQSVASLLREAPQLKLIIHTTFSEEFRNNLPPADLLSTWEVWDTVRKMCDYPTNLSLALEVPKNALPSHLLDRWFTEPISMLILSAQSTFVPNPKGFPVLPKHTQQLVHKFTKKQPFYLLKDIPTSLNTSPEEMPYAAGDACLIYLRHIMSKQPAPSRMDIFSEGYADILQLPLQPLNDDLETPCYEVFERDESKYDYYEHAIQAAVENELRGTKHLMILVAGAGRGPLVERVLRVCAQANRRPLVFAVEKNPGAAALLQNRKATEWGASVEVVMADIRHWKPPHRIHLVVSELLGSIGDNELSPECLESARTTLEPNGVMIPRCYTAFAAPVASPMLYMAARAATSPWTAPSGPRSGSGGGGSAGANTGGGTMCDTRKLQTPYVVRMQQVETLAPPQPLWQFFHPGDRTDPEGASQLQFARHRKLSFAVRSRNTVYGFAGYFEAELYPGIELSTNPDTQEAKSPDLVSWFPFWFPLASPLALGDESEIDLSIWRLTSSSCMWYEWLAEGYFSQDGVRIRTGATALHNMGGAFFSARY